MDDEVSGGRHEAMEPMQYHKVMRQNYEVVGMEQEGKGKGETTRRDVKQLRRVKA